MRELLSTIIESFSLTVDEGDPACCLLRLAVISGKLGKSYHLEVTLDILRTIDIRSRDSPDKNIGTNILYRDI